MTTILRCTCQHAVQGILYGVGMRVHNLATKLSKDGGYRCTVCGSEKQRPSAPDTSKKPAGKK